MHVNSRLGLWRKLSINLKPTTMNRKFVLVLLAIFLLISGSLKAQYDPIGYSFSPKFGVFESFDEEQLGVIAGLEASMKDRNWIASTHYFYGYELVLLDDGPPRYFHQASLLFGKSKPIGSFRLEYQAGIAALWGIRYNGYHYEGLYSGHYLTESYEKPGLVLEVGMDYLASKYFGLGMQLNVNLNTEMPMIQLAMSFSFGKLR